jgi:Holliday junction resolvase RusA-like endonuclease
VIPIQFTIGGEPEAKPRPRAVMRGGHAGMVQKDAPGGFGMRCAYAANLVRPAKPLEGPVSLEILAAFSHPASWSARKREATQYKTSKPDLDNLAKGVMDVLTTCEFWGDDAQVVHLVVRKRYATNPHTTVTLTALEVKS